MRMHGVHLACRLATRQLCHADGKHPKSDGTFFQRREFCFTLDGDIFVRYQSFKVCALCTLSVLCAPRRRRGRCRMFD
jgi:hypothetical protein